MAEDKDAAPKKEARESTPKRNAFGDLKDEDEDWVQRFIGPPFIFLFKLFLMVGGGCLGGVHLWFGAGILLDWEKAHNETGVDGLWNVPIVLFCFVFGYYIVREWWVMVTDPKFWRVPKAGD